ncbi:MAG: hypothetical protein AAGF72_05595 [Pseudomonadota bacterium]
MSNIDDNGASLDQSIMTLRKRLEQIAEDLAHVARDINGEAQHKQLILCYKKLESISDELEFGATRNLAIELGNQIDALLDDNHWRDFEQDDDNAQFLDSLR